MKPPLVEFLLDPVNYAEHPEQIELVETHISWVFLTDRFAYKLKKPVRFDFLDFSTVARRKQACWDELRLNRRLAPEVYLDVRPLMDGPHGKFHWGGPGEPLDWIVKMRRLPADACLLARLERGTVNDRQIRVLADFLADFYRQQAPLTLQPDQVRGRLVELIQSNQTELGRILSRERPLVERIHAGQLKFAASHAPLLDSRVCDGRYVDGHGDLRPEHIYLLPQPVVIDCIEFSSDLRRLDILDELAFLSMECDAGGYPHVGEQIVQRYREVTGDPGPVSLLAFYKSYRACVRAKVCALRAIQESGTAHATAMAQALKYLKISQREQLLMIPQRLIVVSGLMGTGKSSLARDVAERLDATLLQTDELRRQKFGASPAGAQYGEGFYRPSLREEVYEALFEQADRLLARGHSVVLDGTFAAARHRHAAQRLAERRRAEFLLVRCQCPRHAAIERIERRRRSGPTTSEARGELFDQQAAEWESDTDGMARPLVMDTQRPLAQQAEQVVHRLEAGE